MHQQSPNAHLKKTRPLARQNRFLQEGDAILELANRAAENFEKQAAIEKRRLAPVGTWLNWLSKVIGDDKTTTSKLLWATIVSTISQLFWCLMVSIVVQNLGITLSFWALGTVTVVV